MEKTKWFQLGLDFGNLEENTYGVCFRKPALGWKENTKPTETIKLRTNLIRKSKCSRKLRISILPDVRRLTLEEYVIIWIYTA